MFSSRQKLKPRRTDGNLKRIFSNNLTPKDKKWVCSKNDLLTKKTKKDDWLTDWLTLSVPNSWLYCGCVMSTLISLFLACNSRPHNSVVKTRSGLKKNALCRRMTQRDSAGLRWVTELMFNVCTRVSHDGKVENILEVGVPGKVSWGLLRTVSVVSSRVVWCEYAS